MVCLRARAHARARGRALGVRVYRHAGAPAQARCGTQPSPDQPWVGTGQYLCYTLGSAGPMHMGTGQGCSTQGQGGYPWIGGWVCIHGYVSMGRYPDGVPIRGTHLSRYPQVLASTHVYNPRSTVGCAQVLARGAQYLSIPGHGRIPINHSNPVI